MNLPNKLTLVRVGMIPVFLVVLMGGFLDMQTARIAAVAIFALASFTDFLDGYIARKYKLITNFGKFMDPLADKLLVCAALVAMVALGDIAAWVVIVIISREFLVTGLRLIAVEQGAVLAAGVWGKLKTVSQMLMIMLVLLSIQIPVVQVVGQALIWLSAALTVVSGVEYFVKNIHVIKDVK